VGDASGTTIGLTEAQRALVEGALALVDRMADAQGWRLRGLVERGELVALGRAALCDAARTFDPARGTPFDTFAWARVNGAMVGAARDELDHRHVARSAVAAAEALAGDWPLEGDVLRDGDDDHRRRLETFADGLAAAMFASALGTVATGGEDEAVGRLGYAAAMRALGEAKARLGDRDRRLVELHYEQGVPLRDAADALGVSYATVRRMHRGVVERLGKQLREVGVEPGDVDPA
jgi:RNA polymerase sigma factor for flagellar operon FliA